MLLLYYTILYFSVCFPWSEIVYSLLYLNGLHGPLCAFLWRCPVVVLLLQIFMFPFLFFSLTQVIFDSGQGRRSRVSEESEVSSCQTDPQVNTGKQQMAHRSLCFIESCFTVDRCHDRCEAVWMSCRVWLWQTWKRLRRPTACHLKTDRRRKEALWMKGPVWGKAWQMTGESKSAWQSPRKRRRSVPNGARWTRLAREIYAEICCRSGWFVTLEDVCDLSLSSVVFSYACTAGQHWTQVRNPRWVSDTKAFIFIYCWILWPALLQWLLQRSVLSVCVCVCFIDIGFASFFATNCHCTFDDKWQKYRNKHKVLSLLQINKHFIFYILNELCVYRMLLMFGVN